MFHSSKSRKKSPQSSPAYDDLIENNRQHRAAGKDGRGNLPRMVRAHALSVTKKKRKLKYLMGGKLMGIDSIGKIVTGKTPSTSNSRYFGGPYLFIKTPDMHGNTFYFLKQRKCFLKKGLIHNHHKPYLRVVFA
ncbi:MAG: hypothetical protein MRJ52_11085 [Nitrosomonas sp.]|nr:hypothetical protein [Nitrosomonas sp.]